MNKRIIEVVEYDPNWTVIFEAEKKLLMDTLGALVEKINHIGSTSVPGLAAKPVIDIILEVTSLYALDELNSKMESIGYFPKGEFGIPGRRYFQKGGNNRTHQIHAFKTGDPTIDRHYAFRDYLKSNPGIAKEYAILKKAVAKSCENDIERYCDGKDAFIKEHELKALRIAENMTVKAAENGNKILWNELAPVHLKSYKMDRLKQGGHLLDDIQVSEVGKVVGKSLLHLQCHIGTDSLSWSRLGASVTGVDLSDKSIEIAKKLNLDLELDAEFIESGIYEFETKIDKTFDIVYTSQGVLCWLSDLKKWGEIIFRSLKPDGFFYIMESHPLFFILPKSRLRFFL